MSSAAWRGVQGAVRGGLLYKHDFVLRIYTKIYLTEEKFSPK
jgi:hypothetical protein